MEIIKILTLALSVFILIMLSYQIGWLKGYMKSLSQKNKSAEKVCQCTLTDEELEEKFSRQLEDKNLRPLHSVWDKMLELIRAEKEDAAKKPSL